MQIAWMGVESVLIKRKAPVIIMYRGKDEQLGFVAHVFLLWITMLNMVFSV